MKVGLTFKPWLAGRESRNSVRLAGTGTPRKSASRAEGSNTKWTLLRYGSESETWRTWRDWSRPEHRLRRSPRQRRRHTCSRSTRNHHEGACEKTDQKIKSIVTNPKSNSIPIIEREDSNPHRRVQRRMLKSPGTPTLKSQQHQCLRPNQFPWPETEGYLHFLPASVASAQDLC